MDWRLGIRACGWGLLMMLVGAGNALKDYAPNLPGWVLPVAALAALVGTGAAAYVRPPKADK